MPNAKPDNIDNIFPPCGLPGGLRLVTGRGWAHLKTFDHRHDHEVFVYIAPIAYESLQRSD